MQLKAILVPMPDYKGFFPERSILKCIQPIGSARVGDVIIGGSWMQTEEPNIYWHPQQLVMLSDEQIRQEDWANSNNDIVKVTEQFFQQLLYFKQNSKVLYASYKKIVGAYPEIKGLPTLELSNIKEWIARKCPELVEVDSEMMSPPASEMPAPYYAQPWVENNRIKILWNKHSEEAAEEATELNDKEDGAIQGVMSAEEWFKVFSKNHGVKDYHPDISIYKPEVLMLEYARYYHEEMQKQIISVGIQEAIDNKFPFKTPSTCVWIKGNTLAEELRQAAAFGYNLKEKQLKDFEATNKA